MRKQVSKEGGTDAPVGTFPVPLPINGAMEAIARAGEAVGAGTARCQREMADFIVTRMKADMDLQTSIAGCGDVTDLAKVQREWATATAQAYFDEGRKLAEIGTGTMRDSITSWLKALRSPAKQDG